MLLTLQQCETCPYWTEQHEESCYYFSTSLATRSQAFSNCSKYELHLVYIETAEEQDFIEGRMEENNVGDYWIGLTVDSDGQGVCYNTYTTNHYQTYYNNGTIHYNSYINYTINHY
ncbi:C-type lectin domain family 4 member E-like [Strongylocentrotus purpuratus]|uniref:C-type lectin domain-containing protein n=1 Tax=Strongylocentrotus purpuratus TaxID=7668 RepID=A0A7M7N4J9_STRPU|nr:C-type lectin domain family 4 member E-like [Strongylocentrotus purpuratus]